MCVPSGLKIHEVLQPGVKPSPESIGTSGIKTFIFRDNEYGFAP